MLKKKMVMGLAFMLLFSTASAFDANAPIDSNASFGEMGEFIVTQSFGDWTFFGLILIVISAAAVWRSGSSKSAGIPLAFILVMALVSIGSPYFTVLLNLLVIATGVMLALAVIQYAR